MALCRPAALREQRPSPAGDPVCRRIVGKDFSPSAAFLYDLGVAFGTIVVRKHHNRSRDDRRIITGSGFVLGGGFPSVNDGMIQRNVIRIIIPVNTSVCPPCKIQSVQHIADIVIMTEGVAAASSGVPEEIGEQRSDGEADEISRPQASISSCRRR